MKVVTIHKGELKIMSWLLGDIRLEVRNNYFFPETTSNDTGEKLSNFLTKNGKHNCSKQISILMKFEDYRLNRFYYNVFNQLLKFYTLVAFCGRNFLNNFQRCTTRKIDSMRTHLSHEKYSCKFQFYCISYNRKYIQIPQIYFSNSF